MKLKEVEKYGDEKTYKHKMYAMLLHYHWLIDLGLKETAFIFYNGRFFCANPD